MAAEEEDNPKDFRCGLFSWRPKWLQRFVKPLYFTAVYLTFGIIQGAMKTGLSGSMTTIEKKFGLSGKMMSIVMIADNVTGTLFSLIIGYYATKVSRPRIITFGVWNSIAACFCFVLPHLLYGGTPGVTLSSNKGAAHTEFCEADSEDSILLGTNPMRSGRNQLQEASVAIPVVVILFIANMLNGIGGTAFYIAGTTYTDDNVKKKNTPLYFGAMMGFRMLGPLIGISVNSFFLNRYENPFHPPAGMTPRDPRWVGAWWVTFVLWGFVMVIVSIPLMLFPRYIRKPIQDIEIKKASNGVKKPEDPKSLWQMCVRDARDFVEAVRRLSKNPVYMWKIIGLIFIWNGLGGYFMNFSKYIENQYRISPSKANILTGSTKVTAIIIGLVMGGFLIHRFKPNARQVGIFAAITDVINIAILYAAIYLPCENWRLSGTTVDNGRLSLENSCNEGCHCSPVFQPFCDVATSKSYFNPCYGGCSGENLTSMYCGCAENPATLLTDAEISNGGRYSGGFCANDCQNLMILVIVTSIGKLIGQLPRVGSMLVSLRCVAPADKALAIGFTGFCLNILAAIPYPIIYGAVFDSACLIWGQRDGKQSNCWYYDNDKLRAFYLGITIAFYAVGVVCMLIMAYYAKRVGNMYDDETEEKSLKAEDVTVNGDHIVPMEETSAMLPRKEPPEEDPVIRP